MAVYSLFGQAGGGTLATGDGADYTMGMQFTLSTAAALTGIWFYSATGATALPAACCIYQITGTNTGTQVTGTVNNSPTWSAAAGSGWVKVTYPGTTTLTSGLNYRVCVYYGGGGANWYSATGAYWSSGPGSGGLTSGIISAPAAASADGGNQDAFISPSPAGLNYPNASFNAANYWADVEVTTAAPAASTSGPPVQLQPRRLPVFIVSNAGWRNAGHSR